MGAWGILRASVLLALLAPHAAAFYREDLPLLAAGGGDGTGWVSFTFESDGDFAVTEVMAHTIGDAMVATYVFDEQRTLFFSLVFTTLAHPTDGVITSVHVVPGVGFDDRNVAPIVREGVAGIGLTLNDPGFAGHDHLGTFHVLLYAAGDADSWSWAFRGGSGTGLRAVESGTSTFLRVARDFEGAAHVERYDEGMGARAQVATSTSIAVADQLFGVAYVHGTKSACAALCVGPPSGDVLTLAAAPGLLAPERCFCTFVGGAPGAYRFDLAGADASSRGDLGSLRLGQDMVIVGGADARLPR